MNYLAHLLLAGEDPESRLGGLIADFTRGRLEKLAESYPPGIVEGIALHRRIDRFTDRHHRFALSKSRFSSDRRRYAGIILDVLYDHFLSRHWSSYSKHTRTTFIQENYRLLADNMHTLPDRLQRIAPIMIEQDWLGSYRQLDQVGLALDRMSRRLRRPNNLAGALVEIEALYPLLEQDFRLFFPDLMAHSSTPSQ